MKNEVRNVVESLVGQMDTTIVGVYDTNDGKTLSCNTKWTRIGKTLTDQEQNSYLVTDVDPDNWIETSDFPTPPNMEGIIQLPVPFFISGTRMATNMEWTKASPNLLMKTPLIWLLEVIRFRAFGRESTVEFETEIRVFFLDETNVTQYTTEDHRENVVFPMQQLAKEFIETIGRNRNFQTVIDYEIITFSRFGVEQTEGMFKNILDANLSGVELRINLVKYKENCKC